MLPSVLNRELMKGVGAFLRATLPPSTPKFREAFDVILNGVGRDKLSQGPYLRVGLPFQPGRAGTACSPSHFLSLHRKGCRKSSLQIVSRDFKKQ
jgi:hypothetical protein